MEEISLLKLKLSIKQKIRLKESTEKKKKKKEKRRGGGARRLIKIMDNR